VLTATVAHITVNPVTGVRAVTVHFPQTSGTAETGTEEEKPGPSPIVPEPKEIMWTSGAFVVFAVLMRYVLYPRLRKGMDARYNLIRSGHEGADATRAAARTEVADYESELAGVKAEAASRIDAARRTLEAERTERLAVVNGEIASLRATAVAETEASRAAVQGQIESAVADVASRAIELAIGKVPDAAVVNRVVGEVMSVGVGR
jgi:F-type H+-transporting ATPase subunit b